jgi:hypothetical protein
MSQGNFLQYVRYFLYRQNLAKIHKLQEEWCILHTFELHSHSGFIYSLIDGSSAMQDHLHIKRQSIWNAGIEYYTMNDSKRSQHFLIIRRYVNCMHINITDRIWSTIPKTKLFIPNSKALTEVLASKMLLCRTWSTEMR